LKAKVAVETPVPAVVARPAVVAPTPPVPPTPPVAANAAEPDTAGDEAKDPAPDENGAEAKADGDGDATAKVKTSGRGSSAGGGGAENKRMLAEGERMLRAERFAEARGIFEKLTKSKRERGPALVGLAEVSFQEKKYADAARAAELAAERGGGVKARVLLGDAHFRLARYKEAAKAYEDALKLDPGNASAKSGLALANKRM
jgi:tetratricopeptide (TPR) repeat protein